MNTRLLAQFRKKKIFHVAEWLGRATFTRKVPVSIPSPVSKFFTDPDPSICGVGTFWVKDLERAKMKLCQTKEHKPASNFYNCTYVRKSSVSALVLR